MNLFNIIMLLAGLLLIISSIGSLFRKKGVKSKTKRYITTGPDADGYYYILSPIIIGIILIIISFT